jgi:hypothetical protein
LVISLRCSCASIISFIVGLYMPSLVILDMMDSRCSGDTLGMFRFWTSGSLICSKPESEEMEQSEKMK